MSRTYRSGWKSVTGFDEDSRGIKHHATNDWFSKKNSCEGIHGSNDEYWGRDKQKVKQITRRMRRRQLKNEEFLWED